MKSNFRFLASALLASFLCSAPSALGQPTVNAKVSDGIFLSQTATTVLVLALGPGDHWGGDGDHGKKGCGDRDRDGRRGGNCSQVPEGGTNFMYLTLAGLCCLATGIFTIRRRTRLPGTN
jgi:hypothetical protein